MLERRGFGTVSFKIFRLVSHLALTFALFVTLCVPEGCPHDRPTFILTCTAIVWSLVFALIFFIVRVRCPLSANNNTVRSLVRGGFLLGRRLSSLLQC